ncbi:MAG: hypothetical protein ACUVYA_00365, partial [Planctomycetota bacterium]
MTRSKPGPRGAALRSRLGASLGLALRWAAGFGLAARLAAGAEPASVLERAREIPVACRADVAVVGGPTGAV